VRVIQVYVSGAFDDLRSGDIRFLEEASKRGPVTVALWPDEMVAEVKGRCKFPFEERAYVLEAIRFVERVTGLPAGVGADELPFVAKSNEPDPAIWAVLADAQTEAKRAVCDQRGLRLEVIGPNDLAGFPAPQFDPDHMDPDRRRVVVTGCYDWFHSGHVRFFEECSQLGDLYVVVGHDANVRLLKGEGHPLFPEAERRYVAGSCRYVKHALVTSGMGWMDAEPEIALIRPHMYAVNEDGDKPEKRAFCAEHGIEYVVLKRTPKAGLPRRSSTDLRGF
jgi:cytidyltransferase-like protein